MLDEIFDVIMSGKKRKNDDNAYRPRKKDAELSEEEDDDFVEGENLQEPASTGKRKLIVVDGVTQPPPPKKRWAFKCRHCKTTLTFSRSVGKNQLFGDEKPAPPLAWRNPRRLRYFCQNHGGFSPRGQA
ncbi:hypothetical protein MSAN_00629900 [Mycena sanguinolenta]|uniref:Uncharacterized protein n=1 Tax=Mycena sanguinolenta TaxID=230812 RepID=A0A8H7DC37_9AGAR|nr:hypothetical protein MSAN_00629900 [Mycena sanguinolenta]